MMRRIIIESPYAGDIEHNLAYLDLCIQDAVSRGETPYASHKVLPGALSEATQREVGIACGYEWWGAADEVVFYTDLGWSPGMYKALYRAQDLAMPYTIRTLGVS